MSPQATLEQDGRLLLAAYLTKNHIDQVVLARDAECSESHLSLYLKGERELSIPLARRINAAIGNAVPLKALVAPEARKLIEQLEQAEAGT